MKRLNTRMIAANVSVSNNTFETGLNNNDLVIGPTGSGKTGGYVVPNLANPSGSMVVSDTKGQLKGLFEESLLEKGYDIYTIDFVNPDRSEGYNPLQYIRRTKSGRLVEKDIKSLATCIMPCLDTHEPFWEKAGTRYISMIIGYVLESLPEDEQTMSSVCEMHRAFLSGSGKNMIREFSLMNRDSYTGKKFREIIATQEASKMWSSIYEMGSEALDPFDYAEFENVFNKPKSYDLRNLGKKKTVLFLNTSDNDPTFDIFTNIFHTQLPQQLIEEADNHKDGRLKVPVRIILDDFAASAKLPDFSRTISIIRSRNIEVSIVLQSKTQLDALYGSFEAASILNNCDHILYLGGHDLNTAEFMSEHMDEPVNEILDLPKDKAILITHGSRSMIVDKIPPYSYKDSREVQNER